VLGIEIERFVEYKRALRRRYVSEEKVLRLLDAFLGRRAVGSVDAITPDLLQQFLATRRHRRPRSYNELLGVLRRLFEWLVAQGRLERSPVRAGKRRDSAKRIPYLFDEGDARRLLDLAGRLPDQSRAPLRGPTYRAIFALLYGLGLRVGEVSRLQRKDVDLDRDLLRIRGTKFGKDRLVPFGPRMARLLRQYVELRGNDALEAPLFSFTKRGHVHPGTISQTFHHLVPKLDLVVPSGTAAPRVHDLRHAFAVGTLLRWYREGVDPTARLFHLATFLGHVNPSSTAVYLTITPELLAAANSRFEGFAASAVKEVSP
jgi:integrase